MNGIRNRIIALEGEIDEAADACPRCGANWTGSVYGSVDDAKRVTFKCRRCGVERPKPPYPVKCYAAGLLELL